MPRFRVLGPLLLGLALLLASRVLAQDCPRAVREVPGSYRHVAIQLDGMGGEDLILREGTGDLQAWFSTSAGTFEPGPLSESIVTYTSAMHVADFDGDGVSDLAMAAREWGGFHALEVQLGLGDGRFAPVLRREWPGAVDVQVGDFDGDDDIDVVVLELSMLTPLWNRGGGLFDEGIPMALPDDIASVLAARLDDDEADDLLLIQHRGSPPLIHPWIADGLGGFSPSTPIEVPGRDIRAEAVGDVDGDGLSDILLARQTDRAVYETLLFRGVGAGAFVEGEALSHPGVRLAVLLEQFIGGPELDAILIDETGAGVHRGLGDGTFVFERRLSELGSFYTTVADFDGDGRPDLTYDTARGVGPGSNPVVAVLLGQEPGPAPLQEVELPGGVSSFALGELDSSPGPDLAWAGGAFAHVASGVGLAGPLSSTRLPVGREPVALRGADLDGDGLQDLVTANEASGDLSVLFGAAGDAWEPEARLPVGGEPVDVLAVDLDGRLPLDLVVADRLAGVVHVLLGGPARTWTLSSSPVVGAGPVALATADFNRDAASDLVVACTQGASVALLLGRGDGSFGGASFVDPGGTPTDLIAGRFDGDADADLLVTLGGSPDWALLGGRGDGGFDTSALPSLPWEAASLSAEGSLPGGDLRLLVAGGAAGEVLVIDGDPAAPLRSNRLALPGPVAAAVGSDVDLDGRSDLVLLSEGLQVVLARSSGGFDVPYRFASAAAPVFLFASDLNQDGLADVVTIGGSEFAVTHGDPAGGQVEVQRTNPAPNGPTHALMADFDGDARPDLLFVGSSRGTQATLLNDGTGRFPGPPIEQPIEIPGGLGFTIDQAALTDWDGDEHPDLALLVTLQQNEFTFIQELWIRRGVGDGSFESEVALRVTIPGAAFVEELRFANLDGVGGEDLVITKYDAAGLRVEARLNDGSGYGPVSNSVLATGLAPGYLAIGDLDGLGGDDLVVSRWSFDSAWVSLGNGAGSFLPPRAYSAGVPFRRGVSIIDGTGDGLPDVVAFGARGPALLPGLGDGTLGSPLPMAHGANTGAVVPADFQGDGGPPDLVVVDSRPHGVHLLENNGSGEFTHLLRQLGTGSTTAAVADFDGDGFFEPAMMSATGDVTILPHGDDGSFVPGLSRRPVEGGSPRDLIALDLDDDGDEDLVAATNGLQVLVNDAGLIRVAEPLLPGVSMQALATADLDGDRLGDLVAIDRRQGRLLRFRGSPAGLVFEQALPTGLSPAHLVIADFDGRDELDLALVHDEFGDLIIYLGDGAGGLRESARLTHPTFASVDSALPPVPHLAAIDRDGDGDQDLVLAGLDASHSWFDNDGNGSFVGVRSGSLLLPGDLPRAVKADVDRDGFFDLVTTTDRVGLGMQVAFGLPGGGFDLETQRVRMRVDLSDFELADLDGDSDLDVILVSRADGEVSVRLAEGGWNLGWEYRLDAAGLPTAVAATDLDRDGRLELAVLHAAPPRLSVLPNCFAPPWMMRNAEVRSLLPLDPPLETVFTGEAPCSLDLNGPDGTPGTGDDDAYLFGPISGEADPDPSISPDPLRPLVFYQLSAPERTLRLRKGLGATILIDY